MVKEIEGRGGGGVGMSHTVTVSVSNAEKLLLNRLRRGSD